MKRTATIAWLITAVYYFYQYTLRSAPAVMMPQLSDAFGISTAAVASMVGLFYYGYSPFSLVAGVTMDQLGPRRVVPLGAAVVAIGALMFASGNSGVASVGRLLQGVGGVFALVGAAYIATTNFPAVARGHADRGHADVWDGRRIGRAVRRRTAIASGVGWKTFWVAMGVAGLAISVVLYVLLPAPAKTTRREGWMQAAGKDLATVFRNPQSILCGVIAGLLFIPTTIFDMVWGVRYLQEARGFEYATAVLRSASVPFGWIIGCPLLGLISDRLADGSR